MSDPQWHWGVSNPGPDRLLIWLEPWAEEFEVPVRSTLTVTVINDKRTTHSVEVDEGDEHIVLWADGGDKAEVSIDGVVQDSASAVMPFPETPGLSARSFLNVVFEHAPEARLGGRSPDVPEPVSLLRKLTRRLRFWR